MERRIERRIGSGDKMATRWFVQRPASITNSAQTTALFSSFRQRQSFRLALALCCPDTRMVRVARISLLAELTLNQAIGASSSCR